MNNFLKNIILQSVIKIDEHVALSVSVAQMHQRTFLPYKNFCKGGRDIVICGAGPTLQHYHPIKGAIHIAVNRAFLYEQVDFEFIFAQDMDGIRMVQDELSAYRPEKCIKLFAGTSEMNSKTIPESYAIKCNALRFICDYYIYRDGYNSKMVCDLENRAIGGMPNVGMSVIQFALYMNPRRVYIVGCDMSGTHFTEGNQKDKELSAEKNQYDSYWKIDNEKLIKKWREIKDFAEKYYPDTEIITINPVGLKGIFKDEYQSRE